MGETLQPVTPRFNRSLRVECREDRLTGEPGAVLLREVLEASGIVGWLGARLRDPRRQADVLHDLPSLLRTAVFLAAQGWRDHDDADALRQDPAMRLASSSSAGLTLLVAEPGLASQPTLSRFTAIMAEPGNLKALREASHRLRHGQRRQLSLASVSDAPSRRMTALRPRAAGQPVRLVSPKRPL
ncbi:MAG: transposase, partial [Rhodobacteraceae bacterium]|nr:transposase [Paracoccaceae bacterium]